MSDEPLSVPADGNLAVRFVLSLADPSNPLATEINAGTSVDASCYITGDGYESGTEEQSISDTRLCTTQVFEQPGRSTESLELTYVYNPADPEEDELRLALPKGTLGYFVTRWGVPYTQAFAPGDIVDVYPIKAGKQRKQKPTENGILVMTQKMFVRAQVREDVEVV